MPATQNRGVMRRFWALRSPQVYKRKSSYCCVMGSIVSDEAIRSGDPRIEGTRITVLDVKRRVIDADENPHVVAGEYGISMAELFTALAYYYEHRDEFADREREFAAARAAGEHYTHEILSDAVDISDQAD